MNAKPKYAPVTCNSLVVRITHLPPSECPGGQRPLPRSEDRCRLLSPELQARSERAIVDALSSSFGRITRRLESDLGPDLAAALADFFPLYEDRPVRNNTGGALFNDSLCLYLAARLLAPALIVESGTYQDHSAWVLRRACPQAEILTFDINPGQLVHREPDISYHEGDWIDFALPPVDPERSLIWFDDHINQAMNLRRAYDRGFRRALFDDNFPVHNLYATGGVPLPTLAMVLDDSLRNGMCLSWTHHSKSYEYVYDDAHAFGARALIARCEPLPDLTPVTRYSPPSAMAYVETVP